MILAYFEKQPLLSSRLYRRLIESPFYSLSIFLSNDLIIESRYQTAYVNFITSDQDALVKYYMIDITFRNTVSIEQKLLALDYSIITSEYNLFEIMLDNMFVQQRSQ